MFAPLKRVASLSFFIKRSLVSSNKPKVFKQRTKRVVICLPFRRDFLWLPWRFFLLLLALLLNASLGFIFENKMTGIT
jgi:hypothetical protein